jgi:hypothetical protein
MPPLPKKENFYYKTHVITKKAAPEMYLYYTLSVILFKLMNENIPLDEWTHLNFSQIITSHQTIFKCKKDNLLRVGLTTLTKRFHIIYNKIPFDWFNLSVTSYKIKCKQLFLTLNKHQTNYGIKLSLI